MLNKFTLITALVLFSAGISADTVTVKSDHPETYTVQKGDTLWDISGRFLNEPWLWPGVWEANPQIENPHLIYPGDVISLQYKDGRPILAVNYRGSKDSRYVRLSPTVREYEKDEAVPAIPIDAIKQFLSRPLVVTEKEMDDWPYVVSSYEGHLASGAGNKIYVRGLPEENAVKRFAVYRKGKPYVSPDDSEVILGYEALHVGDAIIQKNGDPASAIISRSNREILSGDRLAEESEADISANFIPTSPNREVSGNIISVIDGVSEIGQYNVVILDIGENQGLESGNVLGVFQSGKVVKDYVATKAKEKEEDARRIVLEHEDTSAVDRGVSKVLNDIRDTKRAFDKTDLAGYLGRPGSEPELVELPEEYSGVLMVFRTFENVSYALVMEAQGPIHIKDTVRNL